MDVTVEGVTTSPSIATSTTSQTALSESSLEPNIFTESQTTIDDSESQVLTDPPFMFSTSMAPSRSSDSPSSQHVTAIPGGFNFDDSVSTLTDARNVSETRDYDLVSTTAGPYVPEIPSNKSEDMNGIVVGTIPPDVLISASQSTEPMFALGKTEESILEKDKIHITSDVTHTSSNLTVEPTKLISTFVGVSLSSTTIDESILPNITTVHLTVTDISPTEEIQSTLYDDYDSGEKVTEIGVMAGPPPTQTISEVSDTTDGLSTVSVTTDATVTFTTDTKPNTTHSDNTSATSTVTIPNKTTTPIHAEKFDSTISTEEESVLCSSELVDEVATKDITTATGSSEKSTKNCTDFPSVQVIIINIHEQNETGKALLIFC